MYVSMTQPVFAGRKFIFIFIFVFWEKEKKSASPNRESCAFARTLVLCSRSLCWCVEEHDANYCRTFAVVAVVRLLFFDVRPLAEFPAAHLGWD